MAKDRLKELVSDWRYVKVCIYVVFTAALLCALFFIIKNLDIITGYVLSAAGSVLSALVPLFTGLVLAYLLAPLVDFIDQKLMSKVFVKLPDDPIKLEKRLGMRRTISILITFLLIIILICFVIYAFAALIMGQLVFDSVQTMIESIVDYFMQYEQDLMRFAKMINNADLQEQIQEIISGALTWVSEHFSAQAIFDFVMNIGGSVVNFVLGMVVSVYLLKDKDFFIRLWRKFTHVFLPMERAAKFNDVLRDINSVLSKFIRGQLLDSLIIAIVTSIALTVIGIDFAVFIGCFAGICNVIPYFGPIMGMIPAVIVGLLGGGISQALLALIVLLIIQQIDGNVIYPKIVGSSMGLHPVFVLVAVTFGGYFWGILGMVIAVPVMAIIQMFLVKKLGSID